MLRDTLIGMLVMFLLLQWTMPVSARTLHEELNDSIDKGEQYFYAGKYREALQTFINIAEKAEEAKDYSIAALAYYNQGMVYLSIYENGDALTNLQKSLDICVRHTPGHIREAEILSGIGGVFFNQGNFEKTVYYIERAKKIAEKHNDTLMLRTISINMALMSNQTHHLDDAERFLQEAVRYSKALKDERDESGTIKAIGAEIAMMRQDYDKAEKICQEILADTLYSANRSLAFNYMLDIRIKRGDFAGAINLDLQSDIEIPLMRKPFYFDTMSKAWEMAGDYRKAAQLKDSVMVYKDSLEVINNRQLIENGNIKLEVMKYQLESDRRLAEQKERTTLWTFIAIFFILLSVMAVMFIYNQKQRARTRQHVMSLQLENEARDKALAQEKMRETEMIAAHQQAILQKEIEQKNREVQASTLFVNSRNALIEDTLQTLTSVKEASTLPEIRKLVTHLTRLLNREDQDREDFSLNFEAADPEFSSKLLELHPNLSASDIKFLSFIKMNMSVKEIAIFLNINPDSCKRRKIRISKKLGLDTSADLYSYLISI